MDKPVWVQFDKQPMKLSTIFLPIKRVYLGLGYFENRVYQAYFMSDINETLIQCINNLIAQPTCLYDRATLTKTPFPDMLK